MKLHSDATSTHVTVEVEPEDVRRFAHRWPCFDGPQSVSFTFERSTGDLVDMQPHDWNGGAALAMSEEAWAFAEAHRDPDPPTWDRFDLCEAWWVLAHDFGLYGLVERLRGMGFRPSPALNRDRLSPNARRIYHQGEALARQTGPWARRIGGVS